MKESHAVLAAEDQKPGNYYTLRYGLVGLGIGLFFPFLGMIVLAFNKGLPFTLSSLFATQRTQPLLWIIDTAPLILGLFAMLIGRREDQLELSKQALQNLVANLEDRVADRASDLTLAADVSLRVSQVRDINKLLSEAVTLIQDRFDLYHAQIYLTDEAERNLVLRASTGAIGQKLLNRGHQLPIGIGSINGMAALNKEAVIVADTQESEIFFPNSLLPETRSELAVPLLVGSRVVGVLDLQSSQPNSLTSKKLPVFNSMAGQLAVAIENANLFDDIIKVQDQLTDQSRQLVRDSWREFMDKYSWREQVGYVYDRANNTLDSETILAANERTKSYPIELSGEMLGSILVEQEADQAWSADNESLVKSVAGQVAQRIENLRLLAESNQYRMEAEAATRQLTREGWEGYLGSAVLANSGYKYDQIEVSPLTGEFDSQMDRVVSHELQVRGETVGSLDVTNVDEVDEETTELVTAVAQQLSAHIENLRLTAQTEAALTETAEQARRRALLNEISEQLNRAESLDTIYNIIAEGTAKILPCDRVSITVLNEGGDEFTVMSLAGQGKTVPLGKPQPLAGSMIEKSVKTGTTVVTHNTTPNPDNGINSSMIAPLITNVGAFGTLNVGSKTSYVFNQADQAMLLQIASVLSSVFENRRLFTQIQERVAELAIINEVAQVVSRHLDLQEMLEAVYERIQRVMPIDAYQVSLYDAGADRLSYPIMYEDGERIETPSVPLNPESFTAKVIQTGNPVILSLSEEEKERLSQAGAVVGDSSRPMTASSIFVPLHLGDQVVGVMAVHSYQKDAYDQADTTLLGGIANHVAVALENARLFEQAQEALAKAERGRKEVEQRASELAAINTVAEVASTQLNLTDLLDKVGETLQEQFEAASVYFALYDRKSNKITFPYFYGEDEGQILVESKPLEDESGFTGQIIESRRPLLHNSSPDQSSFEDIMAHGGIVVGDDIERTTDSYLGVPMLVGEEVIGVIGLSTFVERRVYNEADQRLLTTLAGTVGVAIQNARQFERTRRQAEREALINAISQKIQTAPTVQLALQTAVSELGQALQLKQAVVELDKTNEGNGKAHD